MDTLSYVTGQLPYLVPLLLTYLVGIVLAIIYWKRHPLPAMLTLIGCIILFMVAAISPFIQGYIIFVLREERAWNNAQVARMFGIVGIVRTVIYIIGFALVLTAVFAGRRSLTSAHPQKPAAAPPGADAPGP